MKTERRHELQTNWLADRVGDAILVTKPYMKAVTGVLLAAVVVWGAYLVISYRAEAEEANGWNKLWDGLLGGNTGLEDIQSLSDSSPKRQTGEWAQLIIADNDLTNGVGLLFVEKKAGRDAIHNALDNYKSVLQNSTDPLVREHALFGVGRAQESLCDLEKAETAYKQLRTDYPNGSYSARAQQRLEDLATDDAITIRLVRQARTAAERIRQGNRQDRRQGRHSPATARARTIHPPRFHSIAVENSAPRAEAR